MGKRKMLRNTTVFISVLVIITLLLGACFLVYRSLSSYNKQIELMQKDILSSFQMKTDGVISDCTNQIATWMLKERAIDFAAEETVDYYNLNRFYAEEIHPDSSHQEADCIYGIFRPDEDVFVTNAGIIHSWELETRYGFSPGMTAFLAELPQQIFMNNYYIANQNSSDGKRLNIFLKRQINSRADTEIFGFISLNLQKVATQTSQQDNTYFMVYNADGYLFKQDSPENLHILEKQSDVIYDLTYASGVETRNNIFVWFFYGLLFIVLVCIGLFFGSYLAKRIHKPIENILNQLSDDDTEVYDEVAYIQNRFVAIKSEIQQLATQVNAQEPYLKQNFIRDLLYGLVGEDMLRDKTEDYNLKELCGQLTLAVLEQRKSERPAVADFNTIAAVLKAKTASIAVVLLNSNQLAVISKQSFDAFKKAMTQAILQIGEQQGVSYTGAIAEGDISEPIELSRLFNEAMRYLENSAFGYDKLIISKEDIQERAEYDYYYPMELERSIISYIADHDFERALKLLQIILEKNLVELKLNKVAMVELKFAIVGTIKRILQVMKKTESELFGDGTVLYLELNACKTPSEISDKIYEMFSAIQRYSEMAYDTNNYALIDSMEDYIHANYNRNDMSLLLLAEHFNLTVSYISSIFKKYRQINFKDYLTAYRIRRATEILEQQPQIRIVDLSRMVGYDNVNSFIRNFKKLKQVSPGEYKNSNI